MSLKKDSQCAFCRRAWVIHRENDTSITGRHRFKAVATTKTHFVVFRDEAQIWLGAACCAWDARIKACKMNGLIPHGPIVFKD